MANRVQPPTGDHRADPSAIVAALADPTRRAIVERLRRAPCPVGVLAGELPVTRPAVSQHLAHLRGAGLVRCEVRGTRRIYALEPAALAALRDWLDRLWEDALASYADEARKEEKRQR